MKAAAIQFTSGPDLDANLKRMEARVAEAAMAGAKLVVFPEHCCLYSDRPTWKAALPRYREITGLYSGWAKKHKVHLIPGSLREPVPGQSDRFFNTALFFGPDGATLAVYRKLFLFQARLPDRVYNEAEDCEAGKDIVTASWETERIGFSICYDLRFPELFRSLKKKGATIVVLPSAFTVPTGEAHWDSLTRARAVENQLFFIAPGQVGKLGNGAVTYGHTRIVSPWGEILAEVESGEGMAIADMNPEAAAAAKTRVDAWASRREDLFPIA